MPQVHPTRFSWDRYAGLAIMLTLHAAVLYGLWSYRLIPNPQETVTLFVNFINPPAPKVEEPPKPPPPRPKTPPPRPIPEPPRQIVSTAPVQEPSEPVAPPPPPEPVVEPSPEPETPVVLANELSVACAERPAPPYPLASRRLGEQGQVVLRVELDEQGRISSAEVETSSGYARLDEAALNAVKRWRCNAASRGGVPARAIALQPFNFRLQ